LENDVVARDSWVGVDAVWHTTVVPPSSAASLPVTPIHELAIDR
jgi:hypothetical protein